MGKERDQQEFRVLIADHNITTAKQLDTYLRDSNFVVQTLHDGLHVSKKIMEFRPHFILIDLTLPGFTAFECLDFLNEHKILVGGETRLIVMSSHNAQQNVKSCLQKGASDYIVKPVKPVDVLTRIALHLQARKKLQDVNQIKGQNLRLTNYYLHLAQLLVKTASIKATPHKIQFQLVRMLAMALKAVRISLITVNPAPTIRASSDNADFKDFKLQMDRYPEIDYVVRTGKPLFIESLKEDDTMGFVKDLMKSVQFDSMIVLPILQGEEVIGVLSAKMAESTHISDAEIRFCQLGAEVICNYWVLTNPYENESSEEAA